VLGVIAARGGSKGLPRKNILPLGGRPLIAWSIAAAAESKYIDRTIVSTDDAEIAEIARKCGGDVPFLRPPELATDEASVVDAILHAADAVKGDHRFVVLLQTTSPLRQASDIDGAIACCHERNAPACVSMTVAAKSPAWMFEIGQEGRISPVLNHTEFVTRRQSLPKVFLPNGAVFVAELDWLRQSRSFYGEKTVAYEMPAERSVDIDLPIDFKLAEAML
jgi:N-acylneuraminate cytidylyltransferase